MKNKLDSLFEAMILLKRFNIKSVTLPKKEELEFIYMVNKNFPLLKDAKNVGAGKIEIMGIEIIFKG